MAEGGRKWLAYGCFGCLGVLGIVIVLAVGMFLAGKSAVNSEQVSEQTLEPDLTRAVAAAQPAGKGGRVRLDLSDGEFHVQPARAGEPLRIEARYDSNSYELLEVLDTEGEGWSYEVTFGRTSSGMMNMLRQALGGSSPRVDVYLPQDVRLDLELEIAQGGAQVELGGLWLTTAELEFNQGGFQLEIGEPLRQPMERLTIHGSMGGFSASKLGNASPRELDIDFRMGGMDVDLRGHWVQDADVSISFGMGGGNVRLPKDVEIVGLAGDRVVARRDPEIKAPILTFSVSGDLDNLEFN